MTKTKLAFVALLAAGVTGILATVASAATPQNTSPPTISGTPKVGSTLTANEGTWANAPTSFTYQWQRCGSGGSACGDIVAGTAKTYTPTTGDTGHALRVVVTGVNSDGRSSATSGPTEPVNSNGPTNTVRPALSGTAALGGTLRVTNGSWSPSPSFVTRQWQRCSADGTDCVNIAGATGQTYGVRLADVGHRLRAHVTAHSSSGQTTVASSTSAVVTGPSTTTTVVTTTTTTTTTAPTNRAPSLGFISLHVRGARAYARFRVCDDHTGRITIIERDSKARVLSVSRRLHVSLVSSCNVYAKSWVLGRKFRHKGRYAASLRAVDAQGRLSLLRSRSITFR
jgi:Ig domain of plant-specific actin-binding protein